MKRIALFNYFIGIIEIEKKKQWKRLENQIAKFKEEE